MAEEFHPIESIPAYALECLEESEAQAVAEHLATCEVCRAELRHYREVAGQIAFSAPQLDPPLEVKSKLMDRLQAEARPASAVGARPTGWQRFLEALPKLSPAWAVASLVFILILGVSNLLLWQQVQSLRAERTPMQVVALQGSEAAPQATGVIIISRDGRHGTLVVDDLPDLGEEEQYQLWLIQDGERASGGVFSVGEDGYGSVWVGSPEPLASYTSFGVTIEPAGGSPGPTGERVLGGDL